MSAVATAVRRIPSQVRAAESKQRISIADPKTWTPEFCRKMRDHFSGPGNGNIYEIWQRRANELVAYQQSLARNEVVGHPFDKNNCKGHRATLIGPLSHKELKTAHSFPEAT